MRQSRTTSRRKDDTAAQLSGTVWYRKYPVTTVRNQRPVSGMEWCMRRRSSAYTALDHKARKKRRTPHPEDDLIWEAPGGSRRDH